MQGTLVIVRDFRGRPLVRKIWDANQKAVFITDDEHFERLLQGDFEVFPPVGFPKEDVFNYDPNWIAETLDCRTEDLPWERLIPWDNE